MTTGQELVVLNTTLSMFGGFRCKLGVDVEVCAKNMPRGANMSLALNEPT